MNGNCKNTRKRKFSKGQHGIHETYIISYGRKNMMDIFAPQHQKGNAKKRTHEHISQEYNLYTFASAKNHIVYVICVPGWNK